MSGKNNLFDYATKELSQDAFIRWCLEWYNHPERKQLHQMAAELLGLLGETDLPQGQKLDIYLQQDKIDILVILPGQNREIIIEDKVNTGEHSDQIKKYREKRRAVSPDAEIRTVYFKTGFFFDEDKEVPADIIVNGETFLKILQKYQGVSEILDDFTEHLDEMIKKQEEQSRYTEKTEYGEWNLLYYHSAQYDLLCDLLRERFPRDPEKKLYSIEKTRGAKCCTDFSVAPYKEYPESEHGYQIFWRVSPSNYWDPVLHLRFRDGRENSEQRDDDWEELCRTTYTSFQEKVEELLASCPDFQLKWEDIKGKRKAASDESSILTIPLEKYLLHWSEKGELLKQQVIMITECFVARTAF